MSAKSIPMLMLRFDGEVWEIAPGYDTDENSVSVRLATPDRDAKAIAQGVTHVQTDGRWGKTIPAHEVKRIR